jgi:hypothetical protein
MRRVAAEEDAATPEAIGDERVARSPRAARENRRVDAGARGGMNRPAASAALMRSSSSPSRNCVWNANSPRPSTAAMNALRSELNVTFIQAGGCATTS